eukprot:COSAG01_NODE_33158_length_569_cov_0.789362_1_plen_63_part_10
MAALLPVDYKLHRSLCIVGVVIAFFVVACAPVVWGLCAARNSLKHPRHRNHLEARDLSYAADP